MSGENPFERSERMFGEAAMKRLRNAHVAVFGCGGVGGFVIETLARGGVGELTFVDNDVISVTNLNRQILALCSTLGMPKADAAVRRVADICPETVCHAVKLFFLPENADSIDFRAFDYVVDAVDTLSAKAEIVRAAKRAGVNVISAMGAGNKLDPTRFRAADLSETNTCPLAREMRKILRKDGIEHLKVVYSDEPPMTIAQTEHGRHIPASNSFVPAALGIVLGGEVIKDLIKTPS